MKNSKHNAAENNPCVREQQLTFECFDKNNYDHGKCQIPITNYKVCKSFWHFVKSDRRRKGIYPYLPPVEEREQVKKEYLNKVGPNL